MCNCGKKRTVLNQQPTSNKIIQTTIQQPVIKKDTVLFQYTGNTALTITGSVTKKSYRFNFPRDIVPIDFADATAIMNIPVLKRV